MSFRPSVDDLRLVAAVHRRGSVGAAARDLLVAQPSASARLAALERRLGVTLFERDTTGARATDAGRVLAAEAAHILGHLDQVAERTLAGAHAPLLRAATFPSLAALLFPALDGVLADLEGEDGPVVSVHQHVDHGDVLVEGVAEGSLDLAVVALADQVPLPPQVTSTSLGTDELTLLAPAGWQAGSRRRPFAGVVPYHCLDRGGPALEQRISELGGHPRACATAEVTVITSRALGQPALLARSVASLYVRPGERMDRSPVAARFTVAAVTRTPAPTVLPELLRRLPRAMGITPARTAGSGAGSGRGVPRG